MDDPKPCPFCGGEAYVWETPSKVPLWKAGCAGKDCSIEPETRLPHGSRESAVEVWSRRADNELEHLREELMDANLQISALHAVQADLREQLDEAHAEIGRLHERVRAQAQALQGLQTGS